ncbi:hypothetical protein DESUT3_13270 [Desulfuromonas versatilis]|uniref:Response regulator receiver modulated diguanylate cyclase/phosphodiesterase n=1 Tax=Desulfuromonas versatilis TaxID=2802975 RepID=A0ABM8HNB3_9BACT|nr:EAL domain-containing protein [Desulfuromonas versatilis]BCR04258.1 hypothetical protein DESUT3_13270 [Desulfuromonas versatilis]
MDLQGHGQRKLNDATIMIVDDEPINIEVVQAFLEDEGYRNFLTVEDSTRALAMLEEGRVDLLLLDLVMPGVSGFDILAAVRAHSKLKHLPVIILTASSDAESKLRALDLGATDFLGKPLDPSELGLRVRNTLGAKAYQDQLAYYDPLTRLPNRQLFLEELSWVLQAARRHEELLALLSIELDNFEKINNTMGLSAGDEVQRLVVQRVQGVVRSIDVLARAAGDESAEMSLYHLDGSVFSLILNRIKNAESAAYVAERIVKAVKAPMQIEGREVYVTASIGIGSYPDTGEEPGALLRLASSAKDFAKKQGGDGFQFASRSISEMYEKRLRLETRLRRALSNGEFILYYQPKVDLETGAIGGVEALLRWDSDEGVIPPGDFIPMAEEMGLIIPLGEWVMAEACRQLKAWHDAGKNHLGMAINVSVRQFTAPGFIAAVKRIIQTSGIDPRYLTLELTESHLFDDIDEKIILLQSLKEMGFKLSIDDFGTGYSSLSYLRRLPVDELKIDRSFIKEVSDRADSRAIVSTIIFLARSLNLRTVAEGIEKQVELEFLQSEGCQQYQGFLFSRPLSAAELFAKLE